MLLLLSYIQSICLSLSLLIIKLLDFCDCRRIARRISFDFCDCRRMQKDKLLDFCDCRRIARRIRCDSAFLI
uniref:RxLR effector candidate protein n=1 Tax=Hyaloperonospora arabidopsidis (strain Emoy2) TaxID=559515 RepID=M4C253_HYAAE